MQLETIVSEKEEQEFSEFLRNRIREFNNLQSPFHKEARKPGAILPLFLILKDKDGGMVGGLSASTYWNWMEIEHFYLLDELRGMGIGASLLRTAETIAKKSGCLRCFLTTFDFQARVFYEKQGFYVVGKLVDYPPGSSFYWMRKNL